MFNIGVRNTYILKKQLSEYVIYTKVYVDEINFFTGE